MRSLEGQSTVMATDGLRVKRGGEVKDCFLGRKGDVKKGRRKHCFSNFIKNSSMEVLALSPIFISSPSGLIVVHLAAVVQEERV